MEAISSENTENQHRFIIKLISMQQIHYWYHNVAKHHIVRRKVVALWMHCKSKRLVWTTRMMTWMNRPNSSIPIRIQHGRHKRLFALFGCMIYSTIYFHKTNYILLQKFRQTKTMMMTKSLVEKSLGKQEQLIVRVRSAASPNQIWSQVKCTFHCIKWTRNVWYSIPNIRAYFYTTHVSGHINNGQPIRYVDAIWHQQEIFTLNSIVSKLNVLHSQ